MAVLYVVSTPIGNLEDLSLRARRVLTEAALIACEDTRVTRKLLERYQIETPLASYHAHSGPEVAARILARLEAGEDVALVSDAGTPLLSDPGQELVAAALERGVQVVPVPGPSALLAALAASGLPAQPFLFLGFLPREEPMVREVLAPYAHAPLTLVIYESPKRAQRTLEVLARVLGGARPAALARELTKRFEEIRRGSLERLAAQTEDDLKGEVVLIVGPPVPEARAVEEGRLAEELERLLAAGTAPSEVARTIAGAFGLSKQQAYKKVLEAQSRRGG